MSTTYRIRIQGHLHDRWADWFEGFDIERQADGTTLLVGEIVDQAALHGVIARIRDLGIPLISVTQAGNPKRSAREGGDGSEHTP